MTAKVNQVENLLVDLMDLKEKLKDAKEILKDFKVKSDKLTQLTKAKKEMTAQIEEEKRRIEEDLREDKDYEQSKQDELKYKNAITEKNADIKEVMREMNKDQQLSTYDYNIKGEMIKMHVERYVKLYLNGREEK